MRIGFITPLYIPCVGGAEILLDRLARSLMDRGHEAVVVAPRPTGFRERLPYPVVRTMRPFSKRFGLHHCLPNLLFAYWRHRFELLHCHSEYRAAYVARTFKRLTGVPFVVRALGGGFQTVREHPRLRQRAVKALEAADGLIAQGAFLREQMLEFGVPEEKITTIHNGVVPEEILVDGENPRSRPYIFYVGGLRRVKGYDVLLRAFAAIAGELPDIDLVMAGKDQNLTDFQALRDELGLSADRVDFVGLLDRRQTALHYRHALLYVCPFRKSPFSNANLEALTAGLPVVATSVDGNVEQIRNDVEGIMVPPDDAEALADAMKRICVAPDLRTRYAAAATERAKDFRWDRLVDRYEEFYGSMIEAATR